MIRRPPRMIGFGRTPLAVKNVTHQKYKSLTAVAGICFAIILVFMQLGFLGAVNLTATNLYDKLDFDVVLLSKEYEQLYDAGTIPRRRLYQARSVPGVVHAAPLYVMMNLWRCPPHAGATGPVLDAIKIRGLCVLGIDLSNDPFKGPIREEIEAAVPKLRNAERVIIDIRSHPDFGWSQRDRFDDWELGGRHIEIVGTFTLGSGFGADGCVLCSDENYVRFAPWASIDDVNVGLLKLESGTDVDQAVAELSRRLPEDVAVYSRAMLNAKERFYWVKNTATGVLFGFGVFVAMCVGAVVVYQVLANDISNHFAEYATLKAMGYSNHFLSWVVTQQSLVYAVTAYVPALAISAVLYHFTARIANIPMRLTVTNILFVLALSIGVSLVSALITLRKVYSADPAELF